MKILALGLLVFTAGCSSMSHRTPASIPSATQAIAGSGWEGSFTVGGVSHGMRLGFLPTTSAENTVPYFHAIISGVGASEINAGDKACEFTPRLLQLTAQNGNDFSGTIHVYPCASTSDEEQKLEASGSRRELAQVPVRKFELSNDGQNLAIEATIAGVPVRYSLTRQNIDESIRNSPIGLRSWVVR